MKTKPKLLLNDTNPGIDEGQQSWYPEPFYFFAEDETAVISKVTYSQEKDDLLGFCGIKGANHQCLD